MSIEHKCLGCGFSYEARADDKGVVTCPNCGAPLEKPEGPDQTMQ